MEFFDNRAEISRYLSTQRCNGLNIGFVPTMGALHDGHLALIENAVKDNDITVVSVYVNPTQFNNPDDFSHYPRDIDQDKAILQKAGVDVLFAPTDKEMYPDDGNEVTTLNFGYLEEIMEGRFRPGHFKGVGKVVTKLFNIIRPDKVYFGQKDLQQFTVIKNLNRNFLWDIDLKMVPIVRETNGLALSSRNARLSGEGKHDALGLFSMLSKSSELLKAGHSVKNVLQEIQEYSKEFPKIELEYFEIVNANDLKPVETITKPAEIAVCIAGYVENIRLIDNLLLNL